MAERDDASSFVVVGAVAAPLALFMMSLFRRSSVTATRQSMSAFHFAFIKPTGLGISTLGFLAFCTTGLVAWRRATNPFCGMTEERKIKRMEGTTGCVRVDDREGKEGKR